MNVVPYADQDIGKKEIAIITANVVIGVGILTFPRALAKETGSFDGWISVLLAGGVACLIGWTLASLAARFPKETFLEYTTKIISKPAAYVLVFVLGMYYMLFSAFEMRAVGSIAKQFLFTTTPVEMITLAFMLVVQYAVLGTRAALLRLNMLFLPIVLFVIFLVQFYTFRFFEWENFKPFFATDVTALVKGAQQVGLSFSGFEIILFYGFLMKRPEEAPRAVVVGLSIPILLYALIYIFVVGVFSADVTQNLVFPTIELAKEVEVPGGFVERVESLFFTIWIMTIFNTCALFLDVAMFMFTSIFRRLSKLSCMLIISPIIYFMSMVPENLVQFFALGDQITYAGFVLVYLIPLLLLLIAKLRGVKGSG